MNSEQTLERLIQAQTKAEILFDRIERDGLIRPGLAESELSDSIFRLAESLFGIRKYWHKRIVRAGANTVLPYDFNPPDSMILEDDILWVDYGPIFDEYEADFGRTYVLGSDPIKLKLKEDAAKVWSICRNYYIDRRDVTGSELYSFARSTAEKFGYRFGGEIAGHLIDRFSHHKIHSKDRIHYIREGNEVPLNEKPDGKDRFWILETHLVLPEKNFGAFYEELLI
ncbi:aminopeptidase P family protein [Leptospira gomenensis]|uniref:Aminopeptidase P family protein n=1 Tax=Leptospira gomenensis TaxID=2484974 RepID=A0A5F1YTC3_9LEPT|nr:M24 family metallopeptidase [Leptospira gomenensis]TGK31797.1 aminopeptidase P family protein [Leptospira gomenensis]TGK34791.1 aminopeptidase P family protein [Leptospira gomenensis]TGK41575.1 aminopeptidase P family protein [Leptospira gomenensis]TGK61466.1 aminopeptidase P family protein [Leptospira gomenensis]